MYGALARARDFNLNRNRCQSFLLFIATSARPCPFDPLQWTPPQLHCKALYNSHGKQHGHVSVFRHVSPDEFDAAAATRPAVVRRLWRAAGDERSGRQLLADWKRDHQVRAGAEAVLVRWQEWRGYRQTDN